MSIETEEIEIKKKEDWRQEELKILVREGIIEEAKSWRRLEVEGLNFEVETFCDIGDEGRMCEQVEI